MDAGDVAVLVLDAAQHVQDAWEALQALVEEGLLPTDLQYQYEVLGAVDSYLSAYVGGMHRPRESKV